MGSGQWGSFCSLPHCLRALLLLWNSFCTLPHFCTRLTSVGLLTVELLLLYASVSGHWKSFCALPHCPGAVGLLYCTCHTAGSTGKWNSSYPLPHFGQRAVEILLYIASLHAGCGQWNSFYSLPPGQGNEESKAEPLRESHCPLLPTSMAMH